LGRLSIFIEVQEVVTWENSGIRSWSGYWKNQNGITPTLRRTLDLHGSAVSRHDLFYKQQPQAVLQPSNQRYSDHYNNRYYTAALQQQGCFSFPEAELHSIIRNKA
jgi:hypothetical protein